MRTSITSALGVGLCLAAAAGNPALAATCADLEAWAGKLSNQQVWVLNTIDQRVRLFEVFRAPEFESLFGKPALALSEAEVKSAADALGKCALEARAARRGAEQKMLSAIQGEFSRRLAPLLVQVRDAHSNLEPALAALEALPPSRALLRALDTLRQVGAEVDLRPGMGIPEGRQLVTVLARLPQEDATQAQPRLAALHARVREAVLAESVAAIAAAPATLAGLGTLDQILKTIKYELGPALGADGAAALDAAAASRRDDIVKTLLAEAGAAIQAVPDSMDGARQLPQVQQRIRNELQRVATAEALAVLDQVAQTRRAGIETALVADAKAAIDAGENGLPGLAALQQVSHLPVMQVLSQPGRDAVMAHASGHRAAIVNALVAGVAVPPATVERLGILANMLREPNLGYLTPEERNRFQQAVVTRRGEIATGMLAEPIARLAKFDTGLAGMKAMVAYRNETLAPLSRHLAAAQLAPFEQAFQQHLARAGESALPEFQKLLAKVPQDDKGIAAIQQALQEVGGGPPAFQQAATTRRREIQQTLASTAVEQMCGEALTQAKVSKGDAKTPMLSLGGNIMTLGEFVCRLKLTEQKLNAYESPSLLGKEHVLKVTTRDGAYLTFTLHEAEVAHGKKALVGFKVADANVEKPLTVQEWEAHLAMLMPFFEADPPSEAACEALFGKPDSQVNAFDQARMFACLMAMARPKS